MGGFCVVFERDGRPADLDLLSAVAGRLGHRGPDGGERALEGAMGLAAHSFWTTPEDRGSSPLVRHPDGRRILLWDGRLDNRDELIAALELDRGAASGRSDADLVCAAFERWEHGCWERLIGPFAAAVCDPPAASVTLVRDPLGDRGLFYHLRSQRLLAASEEHAVCADPAVERLLDPGVVARYLAIAEPQPGSTFFSGVREVLPGERVTIDGSSTSRSRWWRADPTPRLRYRRMEEYADHFRELLGRAVEARLRSVSPPVLQMSGGLDSTSIAALACGASQRPLTALSWVFDELLEADEREFMGPLIERYPIESVHLAADDRPAFHRLESWPSNPNAPEESVFRPLVEWMYRTARERGSRVMLTGLYGDNLYLGGERWWLDLWWQRGAKAALPAGWKYARSLGALRFAWRHVVRPLMPRRWREHRAGALPEWITPHGEALLRDPVDWPPSAAAAERPQQHRRLLSLMNARATVAEQFHLRSHRIDLRNPFRDRRVVEFMLAVPAYLLECAGETKAVLRRAMRDLLPPRLIARRDKSSFAALCRRGMTAERRSFLWSELSRHGGAWQGLVDRTWLERTLWSDIHPQRLLVLTRCFFLGRWAESAELVPAEPVPYHDSAMR